jgi:hypothetical protein
MTTFVFDHFSVDGVNHTENPLSLTMTKDTSVIANYVEESEMGTITFSGLVSAQEAAGELVTVTITKPDGSKATVSDATDAARGYSVAYTDVAGSYSAVATIPSSQDANNIYSVATSPTVPFTLAKTNVARTITLNVA